MLFSTAAEYLDCSIAQIERLVRNRDLGPVQYMPRGDRRLLRTEIDNYLERIRDEKVVA